MPLDFKWIFVGGEGLVMGIDMVLKFSFKEE